MKVQILLILMGSMIFLHSCAPTRVTKMVAVASSNQKIDFDGTITSKKKHVVSLSTYSELDVAKDKTMFMLDIENCGEEPINIDYYNISVYFEDDNEKGDLKWIKVQHYDDFMNDIKEEYSNKEKRYIKSALEDIKIDIEAAYARSSSSSSSDISSSSDFTASSTAGVKSSFSFPADNLSDLSDSAIESVKNDLEDLRMDIEVMRSNNKRLEASLQEILLQPSTIKPGDSYTGIVVCDKGYINSETEGYFLVIVSVDGEKYEFIFKRSLA